MLCELAHKVHEARPTSLDMKWLTERRSVQVSMRTMLESRRKAEDRRDLELLALSQAIQEKYPEELVAGMAWCDYVQEVLDFAVDLVSDWRRR